MVQLKDQEAFETSSLIGHSARVYALYYKDGLLCTGTWWCHFRCIDVVLLRGYVYMHLSLLAVLPSPQLLL